MASVKIKRKNGSYTSSHCGDCNNSYKTLGSLGCCTSCPTEIVPVCPPMWGCGNGCCAGGGVVPGSGGVVPGSGGVVPGSGGVVPGSGGVVPGSGGVAVLLVPGGPPAPPYVPGGPPAPPYVPGGPPAPPYVPGGPPAPPYVPGGPPAPPYVPRPPGPRPPRPRPVPPRPRPVPPSPRPRPVPPSPRPRPVPPSPRPRPGQKCCDLDYVTRMGIPQCTQSDLRGWMMDGSKRCNPCALDANGVPQRCPSTGQPCSFNSGTCYTRLNDGNIECVTPCDGSPGPSGNCRVCEEVYDPSIQQYRVIDSRPDTCVRQNQNFRNNVDYCCDADQVNFAQRCTPNWQDSLDGKCRDGYEWAAQYGSQRDGLSCYKCPSGMTDENGICCGNCGTEPTSARCTVNGARIPRSYDGKPC